MRPAPHDIDVDVAIVGFGPVGQALAALLGRAGHSVLAVERFAEIYRLPRAVHLDHEIMRLLQGLEVADELAGELLPVRDYHWYGADGEPLMTLQAPVPAASGWDPDYTCSSSRRWSGRSSAAPASSPPSRSSAGGLPRR